MRFDGFIGIDYSGAGSPTNRIRGLKVYAARPGWESHQVRPGILARYLDPPLTPAERYIAALERWILGIA